MATKVDPRVAAMARELFVRHAAEALGASTTHDHAAVARNAWRAARAYFAAEGACQDAKP